jgi:SpoVK/Ycf46/Vps4 family AAA+-type ATPase
METAFAPVPAPRVLSEAAHGRIRQLIERAIRRRWQEGLITQDKDGVFTAFLGAEHVEQLFKNSGAPVSEPPLEEAAYPSAMPLGQLVAQLGLGPSEADLVALLLACETDPVALRLVNYLSGNQGQVVLSFDLAFEIVYRPRAATEVAAALMHRDLSPYGRLRRLRMVLVDQVDYRVALAQSLRLHPRLFLWLLGQRGLDPDLTAFAQLYPLAPPLGDCDPQQLDTAAAALAGGGRLLLVDGPPRVGRGMLLRFAAARLGRSLLTVSGRGLGPDRLVAACREACLQGALLAIRDAEEALAGDGLIRLRECLAVMDETVALVGAERMTAALSGLRPLVTVQVQVPPLDTRLALWRRFLGGEGALPDEELGRVAGLYNLGVGGIVAASQAARELARFEGKPPERRHLGQAVRQLFEADLKTVATRVDVKQTWEDLVLPDDVGESVVGIVDRIRYRGQVLGYWGFARKLGKGLGLTVLFSGEPGTGKSMVAGLIAAELGLDLYVINLAQLMSKWLGETEKNLARAFDAAEAGHVLILFDEADTVLGRRTVEVRSANDRYANLETNFLLARIEQFQGIAIFTTNLASAIDPAVARRMSVHVRFPFPDVASRAELWRRLRPEEAPRDANIDYDALARRYELSGGFIRNIVLRAAYLAARGSQPIGMHHLEEAAHSEYQERGAIIVGGRLV